MLECPTTTATSDMDLGRRNLLYKATFNVKGKIEIERGYNFWTTGHEQKLDISSISQGKKILGGTDNQECKSDIYMNDKKLHG